MGAISEIIKSAETSYDSSVQKMLTDLERRATMPVGVESQQAMSSVGVPTSRDETNRRLYKWLLAIGGGTLAAGAVLRLMRAVGESARHKQLAREFETQSGKPTGDIELPLPKSAAEKSATIPAVLAGTALFGPSALHAAGETVGSAGRWTKEQAGRAADYLFEPTGSPLTSPYGIPLTAIAGVLAAYGGYKLTDALLTKMRAGRREREMGRAQQEFESALKSQFSESEAAERAGVKISSLLGVAVDGLAQSYVSGELQEQTATLVKAGQEPGTPYDSSFGRGAGNTAVGAYVALATLLASLGALGGYHFVKSREVPRMKYEAAKEFLLRRQLGEPATVSVDQGE